MTSNNADNSSTAGPVVAIVGATGAVGSTMIEIIDAREIGALVGDPAGRLGPVGRQGAAGARRGRHRAGAGPRGVRRGGRRAVRRARRGQRRVGAGRRGPRRGGRGQLRGLPDGPGRAAGGARGERRGRREPAEGDHRQPQLHDAVDDGGDGCAAPRVRAGSAGRRLLPGGLRGRSARHRPAGSPRSPRSAGRTWAAAAGTWPGRCPRPGCRPPTRRSRRRWRSTSCPGPAR